MEKVLEQALPEVTKTIEVPVELPVPEPPNNNLRNGGIVIGVVVLAYLFARLYNCTAKK